MSDTEEHAVGRGAETMAAGGEGSSPPLAGSVVSLEAIVVSLLALTAYPGLLQTNSNLAHLLARKNSLFRFLEVLLPAREYYAYDHYNGLLTCLGTLLLLLYLAADILGNLARRGGERGPLPLEPFLRRRGEEVKSWLLALLLLLFVALPTGYNIGLRYVGRLQAVHDGGVLQTEAAMDMLLEGRNPYREDYRGTDVERNNLTNNYWKNYGDIPVVHHNPYLPFSFLSALPLRVACRAALGFYDQRLFYLLLAGAAAWVLCRMAAAPWKKRLLVAAVLLNPYFTPFFLEGRNDILPFFLVLLAVYFLQRRALLASTLSLALACATKQFAWVFLPFYLLFLAGDTAGRQSLLQLLRRAASGWRRAVPGLALFTLLVLPFLAWDPAAFLDDVSRFNAGRSELNYPLGGTPGFGLANLVLYLQLVPDRNAYFPFFLPLLAAGVPLLLLLLSLQRRANRSSVMLAAGSLLLFLVLFLSRLFHDNHLGLVLMWLTVAGLADDFGWEEGAQRGETGTS